MKKVVFLEIVLLVLVVAAAAFLIWQVNTVQPQAALAVPDTAQTAEPEQTVEPEPEVLKQEARAGRGACGRV